MLWLSTFSHHSCVFPCGALVNLYNLCQCGLWCSTAVYLLSLKALQEAADSRTEPMGKLQALQTKCICVWNVGQDSDTLRASLRPSISPSAPPCCLRLLAKPSTHTDRQTERSRTSSDLLFGDTPRLRPWIVLKHLSERKCQWHYVKMMILNAVVKDYNTCRPKSFWDW